jgi:hypothetical protein
MASPLNAWSSSIGRRLQGSAQTWTHQSTPPYPKENRSHERHERNRGPVMAPNLNTLGKLVERMAESQPQQWCLISPTGMCYLGPDPLVLAAQATYKPPTFKEHL